MSTPPTPTVNPTPSPAAPPPQAPPPATSPPPSQNGSASAGSTGTIKAVGSKAPADEKKSSVLGWILCLTAAIIVIIFAGVWGMNRSSVSASAPAASAPTKAQPASPGKVMVATAAPQLPAPAQAAITAASQPSVVSLVWPTFSDPRDKPEDWKECGEFLKRKSGLWEPAIEPIPANTKCVLKARELGLAR